MKTFSLNDCFTFLETELEVTYKEVIKNINDFKPVCIPHDWLICHNENFYLDSVGWYRMLVSREDYANENELLYINFDGVYMDTSIYINGQLVYEWPYGYTAFGFYLNDYLTKKTNEIMVRVNHRAPNSRWYSGAGIYRDVDLYVMPKTHIAPNGVYIHTEKKEKNYIVSVDTEVINKTDDVELVYTLSYEEKPVLKTKDAVFKVKNPKLWNVYDGKLYDLKVELYKAGLLLDEYKDSFGFRDIKLDPTNGLLVNGKKTVIHGVCMHHDLGCLGSAYNHEAALRQVKILKEMGCNAIRFAHNPPASDYLKITDEMGILVMDEAFDMWKNEKTPYDYARFFDKWHEKDIESFIKRDRNHPSVFLWSIGNEISDTHGREDGIDTTVKLADLVKKYDPKKNAYVTLASNYLPWENTQKCVDKLKIAGYNYGEACYEDHRKKYPDWVIYGSETASVVASRGVYHFPYKQSVLADDDLQCSSLGNSTTSWGAKSIEDCIAKDRDFGYSMGMFVWSGFDYIGEPTPYHTKNSYMGQIDTAGFPKDAFYIFQSEWISSKEKPMIHVFPYWDYNEGQLIDVRVCTNLSQVELFVNGKSFGKKNVNHRKGADFVPTFSVPYEDGTIEAIAYDNKGNVAAKKVIKSFGDTCGLSIELNKQELICDGKDIIFATITAIDKDGNEVSNAMDYVRLSVSGGGELIGTDNGDSADYDSYQSNIRKLFNGKLLAVIKSNGMNKSVELKAEIITKVNKKNNIPVRNIKLKCNNNRTLTKDNNQITVDYEIVPKNATDKDIQFGIVNDTGISINCASIEKIDKKKKQIIITAKSDGEFRLRATSKSNTNEVKVISTLEFISEGLGDAYINPYELVSGGLYSDSIGNVGSGNERGVATQRDGETCIIFNNIDFGNSGSRVIHLPIFGLSSEAYRFKIYDGRMDDSKAECILDGIYKKDSIWNVYQEETYTVNKVLRGIHTLSIVFFDKVHLKGFRFDEIQRAYESISVDSCDSVYGDNFVKNNGAIEGIGNNVSIEFTNMDFGQSGATSIEIEGRSNLSVNSIHMLVTDENGKESRSIFEFKKSTKYTKQIFTHELLKGKNTIKFLFLPGTQFDFKSFRFMKVDNKNE